MITALVIAAVFFGAGLAEYIDYRWISRDDLRDGAEIFHAPTEGDR